FSLWADMAPEMGVPAVMRDVLLWAFTVPFFEEREAELREFEEAMAELRQPVDAYLAQLESIRTHDATARLAAIDVPTLVLAGEEDILIPVRQSERLRDGIRGAAWRTTRGGHACIWEFPDEFNQALLEFLAAHRADGKE